MSSIFMVLLDWSIFSILIFCIILVRFFFLIQKKFVVVLAQLKLNVEINIILH